MKISTKGRYAIRLMIDIGVHGDKYVRLKDIARRQDISFKYLEQIISNLQKAGLLLSSRGAHGGYKLIKDPVEYSVGEILRATEGKMSSVVCLEDEVNQCLRYDKCATVKLWEGLNEVIDAYLDRHTLAELVEKEKLNQEATIDYSI